MIQEKISDVGEKRIISEIIKPLFNPEGDLCGIGDDCAVISPPAGQYVCMSTDRVPADLISFKLGLIDYRGLGYYLAVLNISDVVAAGAEPVALLLNLAFPGGFSVKNLRLLLHGVQDACEQYHCRVLGGDLSSSQEMSLSATSVGFSSCSKTLYRRGCSPGDLIYCSDYLGLTSTAFAYFLKAKPQGFKLENADELLLVQQFSNPRARKSVKDFLLSLDGKVTCMDNTDGVGQTLLELSENNKVKFVVDGAKLPIHSVTRDVAKFLQMDPVALAFDPGADFQLLGTVSRALPSVQPRFTDSLLGTLSIIGSVQEGCGVWVQNQSGLRQMDIAGWNYYHVEEKELTHDS